MLFPQVWGDGISALNRLREPSQRLVMQGKTNRCRPFFSVGLRRLRNLPPKKCHATMESLRFEFRIDTKICYAIDDLPNNSLEGLTSSRLRPHHRLPMWNTYAITLAGTSIIAMLVLSVALSPRETFSGMRDLFDARILRRALKSSFRFHISSLLWFTASVAIAISVFQTFEASPIAYVVVLLIIAMLALTRVALKSIFETRVRRLPPNPKFPHSSDISNGDE